MSNGAASLGNQRPHRETKNRPRRLGSPSTTLLYRNVNCSTHSMRPIRFKACQDVLIGQPTAPPQLKSWS